MADGSENTNAKNPVLEEVIRCKDCKYSVPCGGAELLLVCKRNLDVWRPEDFCSHGERKNSNA